MQYFWSKQSEKEAAVFCPWELGGALLPVALGLVMVSVAPRLACVHVCKYMRACVLVSVAQ